MTSFSSQLKLLLWKNWILRKRHKVRLFMEFVWPLILFLLLMWVRTRGLKLRKPSCHLIEKSLPSVGGFEFFQNFFCTLNNTCHADYVENEELVWEKSIFKKFVKDTSPILTKIVESPTQMKTVLNVWNNLMDYINVIGGFLSKEETRQIGKVKWKDLMGKYSAKAFAQTLPIYTSLTESQAVELLETDIYLDRVNRSSIEELFVTFKAKDCRNQKDFMIMAFPSEELLHTICKLETEQKVTIFFLATNYINRDGLIKKLKGNMELDTFVEKNSKITKFLEYDAVAIANMMELGRMISAAVKHFTKFSNLEGSDLFTSLMYEGLCGVEVKANQTFGFEPGTAERYDSLRDKLKDWNPDHHYEVDPDISATCNSIFQRLESSPFTALLWRQVKPFIRGSIFYTPKNNQFTDQVMQKVEEKFGELKDFEIGLNSIIKVVHRSRKWFRTYAEELNHTAIALSDENNFNFVVRLIGVPPSPELKTQVLKILKNVISTDLETTLGRLDFVTELLSELISCIKYNKTFGYDTELEAVREGSKLLSAEKLWAVVVFENAEQHIENESFPRHLKYKIRMDSDKVDGTRFARDRMTSKTPRRRPAFDMKYITNGFVYLQEMIEHSIIETITGQSMTGFATYLQQFPYPCFIYDQFIRAISRTFPLFMVLSWVYASSMIVKSVVQEKELRLREVMKVMGLGNGVIWCGWFIDNFAVMSISATLLTLILKYGKVIEHSDVTLIWVFMLSYTTATIAFSFLMSTFFARANSAAAAGGIFFFVSYLPYNMLLVWEDSLTWYHTLFSCFISNVAFGFGCTYFARYEEDGVGAGWDSITLQTLPGDDFNLGYCMLMLWVDSFLYMTACWYIEAVFPGASGVPKKWNFCLKKSYWRGRTKPRSPTKVVYESVPEQNGCPVQDIEQPIIEQEPENLKAGVTVNNLSKTYSNGKVALDDLSITFYENQITSFLGHNGAGKTTCISILTGLFPPTSGKCHIYGLDIAKDMDSIRHGTGICPQYNTLFDRLNVEEHMQFYAGLKGKWDESFEAEFTKMLHDLGIPHKRYDFPKNLSGGMKRKLSVACSFIGGSKTVFLDEPTTGVGWSQQILQKRSGSFSFVLLWFQILILEGRTLILTTHQMDEAGVLGDRIAIISQGKLKACGSSLFLKSQFGQGYSLRLVKDPILLKERYSLSRSSSPVPHMDGGDERSVSNKSRTTDYVNQTELIKNFVKREVPKAILLEDVGSEVIFLLPYSSIQEFPLLLNRLDDNCQQLGILSYGISDTTLEDIFLKITITDIDENAESFDALNSKCKRRAVEMLSKLRNQVGRKKKNGNGCPPVVTVAAPTDISILEASSTCVDEINGCTKPVCRLDVDGNIVAESVGGISSPNASLMDEESPEDEFPARSNVKSFSTCCIGYTQIRMIFLKRLWNSNRNKKAMFFEIILPAVFIAITLAFTLILPPATDEPPRELTPWTYPSPNLIFFSDKHDDAKTVPQFHSFLDGLLGPVGMGTPCLKDKLPNQQCNPTRWSNATVENFQKARKTYAGGTFDQCSCSSGSLQCPDSVNEIQPPKIMGITNDWIYDVSRLNIPEWIEKTYRKHESTRYGGFEIKLRDVAVGTVTGFLDLVDQLTSLSPKVTDSIQSDDEEDFFDTDLKLDTVPNGPVYKVWYENKGWVSSVAYLNAMHNIMLRESLPPHLSKHKSEFGMTLTTHPMNLTKSQSNKESLKTAGLGVIHAVCIIFALSFVPASFTVYLIEERKSGAKHLHLVSGVKPITYWISNFIYDLTKYVVPVSLCLILFYLFDAKAYIGAPSIFSFICLLLLYGWASIPAMYPFSFFFSVPSTAFVVLACMNLFIGVMTTVSTFVLEQFGDAELERIGGILKQVFLIFPHYCLGRGLMELVKLDVETIAFNRLAISIEPRNRFDWELLGKMLFWLTVHGFVFFLGTVCLEYRQLCCFIFKKRKPAMVEEDEDEDVLLEKQRVMGNEGFNTTLQAEKLTKYYSRKKHPAVNGLTFAIERGECFGLLGVNGAGKSTCFKMLTGDCSITSGSAKILGADVEINLDAARRHFGYCPQEDGLDPLLNAYEMLRIYGRLRGMSCSETKLAASKLVHMLGLAKCAKRRCGTYSGGNRRKLSTAIALIGDPDIVFLDEPTSGMDPLSRRKFWKVILRLVRIGKSVVLTSHSMEECEALCSRIAIMVNGNFMCLGSLQHLKNRFGDGYTLTVRCPTMDKQEKLLSKLETALESARLEDRHCSHMKFTIPQSDSKLSDIFNVMYTLREEDVVEDYSVSQTTLDDIFVKFATQQKDDMDR